MATEKYTCAEVIEALQKAQGIQAHAAELLGCNRATIANYIKRHPTVAQAYEDLRETIVDRAERGLIKKLVEEEWPAIRYVLSTLGKDRGYTEKYHVDAVLRNLDMTKLTDDQLERLAAGEELIHVLTGAGEG